ncbi:MAG: glycosyltransferase family 2 protein [Planctomycetes bacterium]|nr:glycosyltransferase family 2 protein [Planctomycetota bacterium]
MPVRNGIRDLPSCLGALMDSDWPLHEVIVVDDASTDDTAALAESLGARVLRLERNRGPAFARNRGAQVATGDVFFFTDADVTVHRDTVGAAVQAFCDDPGLAAVIGSYDENPASPGFVAQYKNLFHHWVHQHAKTEASTFWTGCGAIRSNVFLALGGFHEGYPKPSIEDIELGFRLRGRGHRIRLEKRMLATHSKRWRLWNLIRTDVFLRGVPWIALMLRDKRAPEDLNLSRASKIATIFAGLFALSFLTVLVRGMFVPASLVALLPTLGMLAGTLLAQHLATHTTEVHTGPGRGALALGATLLLPALAFALAPDPLGLVPLALWLLTAATHPDLYAFFAARRGVAFAVGAAPLHVIFQWCCAASVPLGILAHMRDRKAVQRGRCAPALRELAPLEPKIDRNGRSARPEGIRV